MRQITGNKKHTETRNKCQSPVMSKRTLFLLIKQTITGNLSRKLIQSSTNPTTDQEQQFSKTGSLTLFFQNCTEYHLQNTYTSEIPQSPAQMRQDDSNYSSSGKPDIFQAVP